MALLLIFLSLAFILFHPSLVVAYPIVYAPYAEVVLRLQKLEQRAPTLVSVWSAQAKYGTPSPGDCNGMTAGTRVPCEHWFIEIANRTNVPTNTRLFLGEEYTERPQIFLSGNLHGDEQVGPMTLLLLVEDLVNARLNGDNAWLNTLLDTRRVVAIPLTNPWGYDRLVREENGIDPNRDFPYDTDPRECMRTAAGRAVNDAWREGLFTGGLTFHSGMQAIAYEWGSFNHRKGASESPDDSAQASIARVMREAAGAYGRSGKYPVDRMNTLVYPVHGGMEDWAYAASWDTGAVKPCTPNTYGGGYPEGKTRYNEAQLRALNILIETADLKRPLERDLGLHGSWTAATTPGGAAAAGSSTLDTPALLPTADVLGDVLTVQGPGDGHVPRNERLALSFIDLVAPYVKRMELSARKLSASFDASSSSSSSSSPSSGDTSSTTSGGSAFGWLGKNLTSFPFSGPASAFVCNASLDCMLNSREGAGVRRTSTAASGSSSSSDETRRSVLRHAEASDSLPSGARSIDSSVQALPCCGSYASASASGSSSSSSNGAASFNLYHDQYDSFLDLTPTAAAGGDGSGGDATASAWLGWDVGGAVHVDETSALVGGWDPRLPPSLLTARFLEPQGDEPFIYYLPSGEALEALPIVSAPPENWHLHHTAPPSMGRVSRGDFETLLSVTYNFLKWEARNAARQIVIWQALLRGSLPIDAIPADMLLRQAPTNAGATRWVYGDMGLQPKPYLPMNQSQAWLTNLTFPPPPPFHSDTLNGAAAAGLLNTQSPIVGSPDLARRPFETRFGDCFSFPSPSLSSPNAAEASTDFFDPTSPSSSSYAADVQLTQSYLILPYARVDARWREQVQPEPQGAVPQSHWVNAKANPKWRFQNGDFIVQGRYHAVSEPMFIAVMRRGLGSSNSSSNVSTVNPPPYCPLLAMGGRNLTSASFTPRTPRDASPPLDDAIRIFVANVAAGAALLCLFVFLGALLFPWIKGKCGSQGTASSPASSSSTTSATKSSVLTPRRQKALRAFLGLPTASPIRLSGDDL